MRGRAWGAPLVFTVLLLCTPGVAGAGGEISTDRPDVSDNTKTVRPSALQIESGLAYSTSRVGGSASERTLGVELTLRGETDDTGHGDLTLAAKYRFLDEREGAWWPSLGLRLPGHLALDVNAGLAAVGQLRPGGYLLQALTTASLSREVTEALSAFVVS